MCLQANVVGHFTRKKVEEVRELVLRESYICCTFCVTIPYNYNSLAKRHARSKNILTFVEEDVRVMIS